MAMDCNVLVIGASTNGIAIAARLARCGRSVIVIDKDMAPPVCEDALTDPLCAPNGQVRALIMAGAELLDKAPGLSCDKEVLHLFGSDALACCADSFACCVHAGGRAGQLECDDIAGCYPYLCCDDAHCAAAIRVRATMISGAALYRHFRGVLQRCKGRLCFGEALVEGCYGGGRWTITTSRRTIRADVVVNCAGAWADEIARRCDVRRLGLLSCERTCVELPATTDCGLPASEGPCIFWEGNPMDLYCDIRAGGRVQISTAREQPCMPCLPEPKAEEIGTAIVCCEERTMLTLAVGGGAASACLHTYAADRVPILGWTREAPGFFWCAAMGDFGTGCAIAASAMASDMIQNRSDFTEIMDRYGIRRNCLCADRLGFVGVFA